MESLQPLQPLRTTPGLSAYMIPAESCQPIWPHGVAGSRDGSVFPLGEYIGFLTMAKVASMPTVTSVILRATGVSCLGKAVANKLGIAVYSV